jgi:dienelactone hydrolase
LSALPYPLTGTAVSPGERQFLLFEPAPVWRKVTVPVLALWGGEDRSVPASTSRAIIEEALTAAGNRDHTLILYPAGDHGLRIVRDNTQGASWDFPRAVPGVRAFIAEWLREHVGDRSRPGIGGSEWMPS